MVKMRRWLSVLDRRFFGGALFSLMVCSCAGFAYHYYGMDGVSYKDGVLLGPNPKDDIPFTRCEPSSNDKHPCVVMFAKEFFALKLDYMDTQTKLSDCQKQLADCRAKQ